MESSDTASSEDNSEMAGFSPRGLPQPELNDVVQVLMTEEMARRFEAACLGNNTQGKTFLSGPFSFSEDDQTPTYIIGLASEE